MNGSRSARLRCERLEDRTTPTSVLPVRPITVTTAADVVNADDGVVSLREAITDANGPWQFLPDSGWSAPPVIRFAPELAGATLMVSQVGSTVYGPAAFEVRQEVSIEGSGQKITRAADAPPMRLFNVVGAPPGTDPLSTIRLLLRRVELLNGRSDQPGGAIFSRHGLVVVNECTLAGNSAVGQGGAVYADGGRVNVVSSTLTANTARPAADGTSLGGAIASVGGGILSVNGCTLAGNTATRGAQVLADANAALTIDQSILYSPASTGRVEDLAVQNVAVGARGGRNLIGTSVGYTGGVVSTADPLLGALADNGGPTRTMALLAGSPAIDAGRVPVVPKAGSTDQRAAPRFVGPFDLGAFEFEATPLPLQDVPPPLPQTVPIPPVPPAPNTVNGAVAGQPPEVWVVDAEQKELHRFLAYDSIFLGGVNVALADLNDDGVADIITGAGAGGGPHVKVFDGRTLAVLASFFAFDARFTGGVYLAAGDVTGDGHPDIVTGAGAGGGPHVKVFDGRTFAEARSFFAFDPTFRGGVSVAVRSAPVSSDGVLQSDGQIVTGAGPGGGPHVKVFDARTLAERQSYFAYDPAFRGGVNVAVAYSGEIFTGAGPGGGPHLKMFVPNDLLTPGTPGVVEGDSLFIAAATDTGGVRLSSGFIGQPLARTRTADGRVVTKTFYISYISSVFDETLPPRGLVENTSVVSATDGTVAGHAVGFTVDPVTTLWDPSFLIPAPLPAPVG